MKKKLTAVAVASLPPGIYTDAACAGLTLRVGVKRRTWSVFHRVSGRLTQTTIGHFPTMGLADARKAAGTLAERIEAGAPAEPPAPHPRAAVLTLGGLIDRYERHRRRKGGKGMKSLDEALRTVRRGLADYLKLPAVQFSKADLRAARDVIAARAPTAANRFQAYLGPVLRWADSEDLIPHDFSRAVIRVGREVKRDRVLSREEIAAVWRASHELGDSRPAQNFGRLVRFLIVTGQRLGEAQNMRHGDLLGGIWRLAAEDTKAGREHRLKLPPLALEQVGIGEAKQLVFPGEAETIIGALSKLKARLDAASGVTGWRLHDLRRTCATCMQELGVSHDVVQGVLNHSIAGVGGVYLRSQMATAKAEALARWADELAGIVGRERVA